jgi:hypothetical protein
MSQTPNTNTSNNKTPPEDRNKNDKNTPTVTVPTIVANDGYGTPDTLSLPKSPLVVERFGRATLQEIQEPIDAKGKGGGEK